MKKMMMVVMMMFVMAMNTTVANAAVIGEYEKNAILKGTYEVVDVTPRTVKSVSLKEWSEPDIFGNQYRLYWYTDVADGERSEELVLLKHHMDKKERKAWRDANKK